MVCLYVCKISMEEWKEHGLCIRESEVQILGRCDVDFAAFKLVFSFSFVLVSAPKMNFPPLSLSLLIFSSTLSSLISPSMEFFSAVFVFFISVFCMVLSYIFHLC